MAEQLSVLAFEAGSVFTPGAPINDRQLFAGRLPQVAMILNAISQRGYHPVMYGERGVGKTSLSNVLKDFVSGGESTFRIARVNCDGSDTFTTLWIKMFRELAALYSDLAVLNEILMTLPDTLTPDDVRRTALHELFKNTLPVFIFDEFDRLEDKKASSLMADTIKVLSDYSVPATILIIGVADSVNSLIANHQSIERALIQVHMQRMSREESKAIITQGLERLTMTIDPVTLEDIATVSQGLPYIAHLIGLHSSKSALLDSRKNITSNDFLNAIKTSMNQWQHSISSAYYDAVLTNQPHSIYRQVLLACALTKPDIMGFFSAASVREPLSIIMGKPYDIPAFSKHLREFSEENRGRILLKKDETSRRYRFESPLMPPYVVMQGFAEGLMDREKLEQIRESNGHGELYMPPSRK